MNQPARPLLNYYGGKWNLADWIISHFPEHDRYIEVFGGGISVFLRKEKVKFEVINDVNDRIVNIYKCLRDFSDHLNVLLELTPYSRGEFYDSKNETDNQIEDARRALVLNWFGISGVVDKDHSTGFRVSMKSGTDKATSFQNYIDSFSQFHDRIRYAHIEKLDWSRCLEKYDSEDALFYLDPPYLPETRSHKKQYRFEMTVDDHIKLVEQLQTLNGSVVLSGYENSIYEELNWHKEKVESRVQGSGTRTEVLWINPRAKKMQKQMSMI